MRARRTDINHKALVQVFKQLGCIVHPTIGDWDLTVAKFGNVRLVEVKRNSKAKATERQKKLKVIGLPITRVETADDCINLVKGMTPR